MQHVKAQVPMQAVESVVFDVDDSHDSWQLSLWPDGVGRLVGRSGDFAGKWAGKLHLRRVLHVFSVVSTLQEHQTSIDQSPGKTSLRILTTFASPDTPPLALDTDLEEAGAVLWTLRQMIGGLVRGGQWYPEKGYGLRSGAAFVNATRFRLSTKNADATALINGDGVVVLTGSRASTVTVSSLSDTHNTLRERMVEWEMWERLNDDQYVLNSHMFFNSPSQAASVLCGSPTNGFDMWVDQYGTSIRNLGNPS